VGRTFGRTVATKAGNRAFPTVGRRGREASAKSIVAMEAARTNRIARIAGTARRTLAETMTKGTGHSLSENSQASSDRVWGSCLSGRPWTDETTMEIFMATNAPTGDSHRNGAVRKRSQLKTKTMGEKHYTKRSKETGQFMDQTAGATKFKGVRKEKH
jgi:hypothetical protein